MKEREICSQLEFNKFKSCASHEQYLAYMNKTQMTDEIRAAIICLLAKLSCLDLLADFIHDELFIEEKNND